MNPKLKNILIFVVILVVVAIAYSLFKDEKKPNTPLSSSGAPISSSSETSPASTSGPSVGSEFLTSLLSVKNVQLDDSIFLNPAFIKLEDFSRPLIQTAGQGRPNPFAAIGAEGSTALSLAPVLTVSATSVTSDSVILNASFNTTLAIGVKWFEWGRTQSSLSKTTAEVTPTANGFSYTLTDLVPGTVYYFRAGAKISGNNSYGTLITFTTLPESSQ